MSTTWHQDVLQRRKTVCVRQRRRKDFETQEHTFQHCSHTCKLRFILCGKNNRRTQTMSFLTCDGVKRLIAHSRSLFAPDLGEAFGLQVHNNQWVSVEVETISFLSAAFAGMNMIHQFVCGSYRIDLYFPDAKLAVECDEANAHGPQKVSQDAARQSFLELALQCKFVGFGQTHQGST